MKRIVLLGLTVISALTLLAGCSDIGARVDQMFFSGENTAVELSSVSSMAISYKGGEKKITDPDVIKYITDNMNENQFVVDSEVDELDDNEVEYTLKWYNSLGMQIKEIEVVHASRIKFGGRFYDVKTEIAEDGKILRTEMDLDYVRDRLYSYRTMPADSELEFWVTDPASREDFAGHYEVDGWFGAREFYGEGYGEGDAEYVSYLISSYPDALDMGSYVTTIEVTDPYIVIMNGLTASSSPEEWDAALSALGFVNKTEDYGENPAVEYREEWISEEGEVSVYLSKINGKYEWRIRTFGENRGGIIY